MIKDLFQLAQSCILTPTTCEVEGIFKSSPVSIDDVQCYISLDEVMLPEDVFEVLPLPEDMGVMHV